ncbi:hypothetical protein BD413DRAFT_134053 [Trametes elegans]|nr:hypothetical protein BD413DRAFT_134053 [Trametes elegans]
MSTLPARLDHHDGHGSTAGSPRTRESPVSSVAGRATEPAMIERSVVADPYRPEHALGESVEVYPSLSQPNVVLLGVTSTVVPDEFVRSCCHYTQLDDSIRTPAGYRGRALSSGKSGMCVLPSPCFDFALAERICDQRTVSPGPRHWHRDSRTTAHGAPSFGWAHGRNACGLLCCGARYGIRILPHRSAKTSSRSRLRALHLDGSERMRGCPATPGRSEHIYSVLAVARQPKPTSVSI